MPVTDPQAAARLNALANGGTAGLGAYDDAQRASQGSYQEALGQLGATALNGAPEQAALAAILERGTAHTRGALDSGRDAASRQIGYDGLATQGYLANERKGLDAKAAQQTSELALKRQEFQSEQANRMAKLDLEQRSRRAAAARPDQEALDAMLAGAAMEAQNVDRQKVGQQSKMASGSAGSASGAAMADRFRAGKDAEKEGQGVDARLEALRRMAGERIGQINQDATNSRAQIDATTDQPPVDAGRDTDSWALKVSRWLSGDGRSQPAGQTTEDRMAIVNAPNRRAEIEARRAVEQQKIVTMLAEAERKAVEERTAIEQKRTGVVDQSTQAKEDIDARFAGVQQQLAQRMAQVEDDPDRYARQVAPAFGMSELEALGRFPSAPDAVFRNRKAREEAAAFDEDQAYKDTTRGRTKANAERDMKTQALADSLGWDPPAIKELADRSNMSIDDIAETVSSDAWANVQEQVQAALDANATFEQFRAELMASDEDQKIKRLTLRYVQPWFFTDAETESP